MDTTSQLRTLALAIALLLPSHSFAEDLKPEINYITEAATKIIMIKECGMNTIKGKDGREVDLAKALMDDVDLAQKAGGRTYEQVKQDVLTTAQFQSMQFQPIEAFCDQIKFSQKLE